MTAWDVFFAGFGSFAVVMAMPDGVAMHRYVFAALAWWCLVALVTR